MPLRHLDISLDFGWTEAGPRPPRPLGILVQDGPHLRFSYAPQFIERPMPVSPHALPVQLGPTEHRAAAFDYVPGLLADSLPDGWGRLLQDRAFAATGLPREQVTVLDRLAAIGAAGMGALTYRPAEALEADLLDGVAEPLDLEAMAAQATRVLAGSTEEILPALRLTGGPPGGARPKVLVGLRETPGGAVEVIAGVSSAMIVGRSAALPPDFVPYLVKFGTTDDVSAYGRDAGAVEEAYAQMARLAGIAMPETRLLVAGDGQRHFATRRFDRLGPGGIGRLHMHTLSGLLHSSHHEPALDYETVLAATRWLTRDHQAVLEMFRRAVFNVLAHNRDDHAKNFAYLMDPMGVWHLSPAYDLTFYAGYNGYHMTTVGGEGLAPTQRHLLTVAESAGLELREAQAVVDQVGDAVGRWPEIARKVELAPQLVSEFEQVFARTRWATLPASTARRPV